MATKSKTTPAPEAITRLKTDKAKSIAFFTGAGASVTFGYPLTSQLLPRMIQWEWDKDFLAIDEEDFNVGAKRRQELRTLLKRLLPGRQADSPLPWVTTLLSVLDHAIHHRQPLWPGRSVRGLRHLRTLLDHAIFDTLGEDADLEDDEEDRLKSFGRLLRSVAKSRPGRHVGLVTTNYDLSSDWAVLHAALPKNRLGYWDSADAANAVDFGTDWLDPYSSATRETQFTRPEAARYACYKLHGSTNWLRCPVCQRIYINCYASTWANGVKKDRDDTNTCHCSETRLEPQIVAPSFVRQMDDLNLLNVWNQAQSLLRSADHWVIIGYSLPDEDVAIRSLFTRALHCREKKPRVTVIQLSDKEQPKYEVLFGRKELHFVTGGLEAFLTECAKA